MTIKKYMWIDLTALSLIAVLIDVIGYFASRSDLIFFYISLSIPVMLIAYIRWKYRALIINVVIILLHFLLYGTSEILGTIIYSFSILSVSLAMIWFKLVSRNHIKHEVALITLYFFTGYVSLFLIQALAQYVISQDIQWVTLLIRHGVNIIIGWVILMIASKQEDLMVNMDQYLLKQIKDRKDEGLQI